MRTRIKQPWIGERNLLDQNRIGSHSIIINELQSNSISVRIAARVNSGC